MKYFGGIEGGATQSHLVICDESGTCVAETSGLGTNHWTVGMQECGRRIADMVERAKCDASIPDDTTLISLGLSLSGCEQESTNRELENIIRTTYPKLAENYYVCSDTLGSLFTASPIGGMVVISGTGSNALLMNPDGTKYTCGGWGNFLGDEGSAWYISQRAIKIVYDDFDGLQKSPYPTEKVWELIKEHFSVETRLDLLPHCYAKFDKSFFASLCKKLVQAADEGDKLALHVFNEAGQHISQHIHALLPKVEKELIVDNAISVVCVGSVWNSWHLLSKGFLEEMNKNKPQFNLNFVRITKSMAYGACYLGVDSIKYPLSRNYKDNYTPLFTYEADKTNGNISKGYKKCTC